MVRTRVQVAQQSGVGEHLVRGLVRAQLGLALRLGLAVVLIFVAVPFLGATVDPFAASTVFGIRLNWIVLGLLPYPVLYLAGRLYIRLAEQAERDFLRLTDHDLDSARSAEGPARSAGDSARSAGDSA